jgi:adenine-specific DNA-methyltransferase
MSNEMKKFNPGSVDLFKENIDKLKELFPQVVTDGEIDLEMLKSILDKNLADSKEKYQFTWNGKSRTIKLAQTPSNATLLPSKKDSKNWDTTENLYIEGDNLEVLKLLQKTYFNKIKMIYIDPPYNTGNNIIYKNKFEISEVDYKSKYSAYDQKNQFLNTKSNSRFHTDWLNTIYPVLILARNLLTEDGGVVISIDNYELHNMLKICDEIFGENNRIGIVTIVHKPEGRNQDKHLATSSEFGVFYSKNEKNFKLNPVVLDEEYLKDFIYSDNFGKYKLNNFIRVGGGDDNLRINKTNFYYPIYVSQDLKKISTIKFKESIEIFPITTVERTWKTIISSAQSLIEKNELIAVKDAKGKIAICEKYRESKGQLIKTHWISKKYNYINYGTKILENIMGGKTFDYPKSLFYIIDLAKLVSSFDSIILDFFSGSATTAHAVMQLNAEDGGNRKFIMVQLPEKTSDDSEAFKAGYMNICEIGKERIRRAGELVKKDLIEKNAKLDKDQEKVDPNKLDIGFKVFKLEESNFKEWDSSKEPTIEQLELFADPIKEGKSEEDVLYEVLLKYGVFDQEVKKIKINNKDIYSISENYLIVMLSNKITPEDVEEVKKLKPKIVIFRDSGFNGNDTIKINAFYTLTKSGVEEVKTV